MKDLDISLRDEIDKQFRSARAQLNAGSIEHAVQTGREAWSRLPEPKFGWDVSKSYTHALALLYRDAKMFSEGIKLMESLFASGTVLAHQDRPYFVLGTLYYEAGDLENARRWLGDANRISKGRTFRDEPEKYRQALSK